jgi:hypothetical protein
MEFSTPMFWSADELKELAGTGVIGKKKNYRNMHVKNVPRDQSVSLSMQTKGESLATYIKQIFNILCFFLL